MSLFAQQSPSAFKTALDIFSDATTIIMAAAVLLLLLTVVVALSQTLSVDGGMSGNGNALAKGGANKITIFLGVVDTQHCD
ncbi:hypothetical protein [Symmachiella macrocystis]|uniref:hypothetical protein n=1 Tax=Symmachiella macrocystis TaxID=2527985 RepID=UPI0011B3DE78|nr:hypothetical protein [Symmachiella macrocystis]